jgi:hypothetical protein
MKLTFTILLMSLLSFLAGCDQPTQSIEVSTPPPQATVSNVMEIIELPELQSYTEAALNGDTSINWSPASAPPQPAGSDQASKQVQAAIKSEAGRLAKVDYSALSLPDFVTATRSLKLTAQDFTGDELRLDSIGEAAGEKRWAIYSWQGPEIPQLSDRPLVFRWVQVYALYDLKANKVVRLIATVRGEAHE